MGGCNRCSLRRLIVDAEANNLRILVLPSESKLGGYDIHRIKAGQYPTKKTWVAWFMGLGAECECSDY